MLTIVDYGVGNLFSLCSSLHYLGIPACVSGKPEDLEKADHIILPGVGAFGDAIRKLQAHGLDRKLKELATTGKPILGICLGMQLLFDQSYEYGEHEGLGLIHGNVVPMKDNLPADLKIPQIGWNSLSFKKEKHPIFRDLKENDHVYFVHSYYAADCDKSVIATTDYGREITAAVARKNIIGCQFHPEKSGKLGLSILKAFCETEDFSC